MTVSLEAVPRSREALTAAALTAAEFSSISLINIPDLLRFSLRSWEACGILREELPAAGLVPRGGGLGLMPHIRAIDFDMAAPFPHAGYFRSQGINKVLVIAGDPPKLKTGPGKTGTPAAPPRPVYPTETVPFIRKLKAEMPELEVYAAFDPYRSNIRYELDYLKEKEEAGAAGFMSQPFFDLRLLEIYAEYLEGKNVFWGLSPALSESSRKYWESRNRAVFPRNFRPDMYWNVDFGRRVLSFCETHHFNLYLMPIKIDLAPYLRGLFG
ncbi:MAG: methylenetetrahydrofolate reductase [Treponema sp.]|jgi:methylenetetrahydrofolate reductase (NADPH)|nr:methylenetetrahydrofolate reductase [Treponema sp.]